MKKILITYFIALSFIPVFGQKLHKKDLLRLEKNIYQEAIENHDLITAQVAGYHIIALEGSKSSYLDSLAFLYFKQHNFLSCLNVSDKILKNESKLPILELKAISLESLNNIKGAITAYEEILKLKKEAIVAYKLAELQERLKRSAEAYSTLKTAENWPFPKEAYITFPGQKKGAIQNVPFKAAYYNLMAKTSYDLHNYDMALKYYDDALKIFPKFYIANQNKQVIALLKEKLNSNLQKNKK